MNNCNTYVVYEYISLSFCCSLTGAYLVDLDVARESVLLLHEVTAVNGKGTLVALE